MNKVRPSRVVVTVLLAVAAVAAVGALLAQVHSHAFLPDPVVALAHDSMTIPLTITGGRPTVQVQINGSGPYPFILDTGAEGTLITADLAEKLKLAVVGAVNVASPGAPTPRAGKLVKIEKVELGDLTLTEVVAAALDLSSMPKVFSGADAPLGVLSVRGWKGLLVTVDYPASKIAIRRGQLGAADNMEIYQFGTHDRLPTITIDLAGVAVAATVDTGAARGIVLPRALLTKLPLAAKPVAAEGLRTVSGEQSVSLAQLKGQLKIGSYSVEGPELNFVEEFPVANLGYPILRNFAVTVDWQSGRVELKRSAAPS